MTMWPGESVSVMGIVYGSAGSRWRGACGKLTAGPLRRRFATCGGATGGEGSRETVTPYKSEGS